MMTMMMVDALLAHQALRQELKQHCVLCHMWVADFQHIKQHLRRAHKTVSDALHPLVLQKCRPFKSQLATGRSCAWCGLKVWAPGRHSEQCPVLTSWPLPPHSVSSRPQQETMTVDNSQGLNPEADIFRHCMVGQQDQDRVESGQKRPRPNPKPQLPPQRGYRRFPNRGQSEESELVQALARLALRQETQLAELRMDKGLVMFFRQDQISILPGLYAVSKEYNAMVAEGSSEITTPLRTLLLACLMRQFRERVVHMMSSMEGVSKLQAAGWLTADQVWTRQKWCRQTKKLVLDQKAEGMKHADLLSSIDFLLTNLRGGIIH